MPCGPVSEIILPGIVERTIPGKPRPAVPEGECTKVLPCHEVADGFDFPASHRKIKKRIRLSLLFNSLSVGSVLLCIVFFKF